MYDYLLMDCHGLLNVTSKQKAYLENQVNLRMLVFKIFYDYQ